MAWTTTILHEQRKKIGLDMNEYSVADYIYYKCTNPNGKVRGWCYASKQKMADEFGFQKRTIMRIIEKLIDKGFVKKHPTTKYLKTTSKWFKNVAAIKHNLLENDGDRSTPVVTEIHPPEVVTDCPRGGDRSTPQIGVNLSPNTLELDTIKDTLESKSAHARKNDQNNSSLNSSHPQEDIGDQCLNIESDQKTPPEELQAFKLKLQTCITPEQFESAANANDVRDPYLQVLDSYTDYLISKKCQGKSDEQIAFWLKSQSSMWLGSHFINPFIQNYNKFNTPHGQTKYTAKEQAHRRGIDKINRVKDFARRMQGE